MDKAIDELIEQGEAYNKKYNKKENIPIVLYGGMGLMGLLAIWVLFSTGGKTEEKEVERYIDDRGREVSPAEVSRLVREGVTLLDME
jgi:hypothetical protein